MTYNIYLRENNQTRLIEIDDAETTWPPPKKGERWSLHIDGEQVVCEIVDMSDPTLGIDGRTLISQDIFVQRIDISADC